MSGNRYIENIIKTYIGHVHSNRTCRTFSVYNAATSTLEEIDAELLRLASLVFLERYRKLGVNPSKVPEEKIKNDMMFVLVNVFGLCNSVIKQQECEELVDRAIKFIKTDSINYSRVQKSFSDINLGDAVLNRIGKILMPVLMGIQPVHAKIKGHKSVNEMLQDIIANEKKIESVEKKVGKRVENEEQIIDHIEHTVGSTLFQVYQRFEEGLSGPTDDKVTPRTVAQLSYLSSKKVYNYMIENHLKKQYIEIKTMPSNVKNSNLFKKHIKNFIITAISHHILANAHEALGVSRQQVVDAINQVSFEVMFVDDAGNRSYSFTEDMYITLRDVGGKDISFHLKLISINFADRAKKDGSADVDREKGFTNFYVKIPVGLAPFEMSGINEPVFKLQVQITPLKSQINNKAQVSLNQGTSNRYPKNKRLFNKKKKYDWM